MPVTIPQRQSLLVAFPGTIIQVERTETSFFGLRKTISREKQMYYMMVTPRILPESTELTPEQIEAISKGKPVYDDYGDEIQVISEAIPLPRRTYTSENLQQIEDEWEKFWLIDQPNEMSPNRRAGGIL
jgi:hypothetical protein